MCAPRVTRHAGVRSYTLVADIAQKPLSFEGPFMFNYNSMVFCNPNSHVVQVDLLADVKFKC